MEGCGQMRYAVACVVHDRERRLRVVLLQFRYDEQLALYIRTRDLLHEGCRRACRIQRRMQNGVCRMVYAEWCMQNGACTDACAVVFQLCPTAVRHVQ